MNPAPLRLRMARLLAAASAPSRLILGTMSGTSLDGLDMALCDIAGHGRATRVRLLRHETAPYDATQRARLQGLASQEMVGLAELTRVHGWLAETHAEQINAALSRWGVERTAIACLASHGQTVYHAPDAVGGRHATLQIGDGDRLALRTGIPVLSDFRQKEIAAGGEGAPLAPYADMLLFGAEGRARLLLNLGGIANFTWLPAGADGAARPLHGDTGPANTLIDRVVRTRLPGEAGGFDRDGALAARGHVHQGLLAALLEHPYFGRPCPKSTGMESFGEDYLRAAQRRSGTEGLEAPDLVATLTRLTVDSIARTLRAELPALAGAEVVASGGGVHNRTLLGWLKAELPGVVWRDPAEFGIPADAKEAVLFAVLANETLAGDGFAVPFGAAANESRPRVAFGKLSFPD